MRCPLPLLIALVALIVSPPARGQTAQQRQAILSAVTEFADAIEAGDAPRLTDAIWIYEGSVADTLGRDAFVKLIVANKRLERAAAARFGAADGSRFSCHFVRIFTPEDRAALPYSEVVIDANTDNNARVQKPDETYSIRLRMGRARDGGRRWQVVLDILDMELEDEKSEGTAKPDGVAQCRIDRYEMQAAGVSDVAERMDKGEYATPASAEAELIARYDAAQAEYVAKRNALPGVGRGRFFRYR